jgi:hypothetical protein
MIQGSGLSLMILRRELTLTKLIILMKDFSKIADRKKYSILINLKEK